MRQHRNPALPHDLVGVTEAARKLGVSPGFLRKAADEGKIPCYRLGSTRRFDLKEVLRHMRKLAEQYPHNNP